MGAKGEGEGEGEGPQSPHLVALRLEVLPRLLHSALGRLGSGELLEHR